MIAFLFVLFSFVVAISRNETRPLLGVFKNVDANFVLALFDAPPRPPPPAMWSADQTQLLRRESRARRLLFTLDNHFFFFPSFFFFFFIANFVFVACGAQMLLLVVTAKFILPKDPAFCRLISVASLFCMWLMWACVYLCQVSPLIRPKVRVAE